MQALYTTIRELVENSLDAAESAGRLPDISISIEEMDTPTFNLLRGIETRDRIDESLYHGGAGSAAPGRAGGKKRVRDGDGLSAQAAEYGIGAPASGTGDGAAVSAAAGTSKKRPTKGGDDQMYYRITVTDNGCGMPHDKMPNMLGRVLSGSKYGVRQTRGKFGLGAKMALIWAKKSTGLPIDVISAHESSGARAANSSGVIGVAPSSVERVPAKVTILKLDIDIHKNEPRIIDHRLEDNAAGRIGTEISVCIAGAWGSYRARVMHYLQQVRYNRASR